MNERHFRTAVEAILKNWTALQLAVSQGSAGHDSKAIADWMVDATVQWFAENKDLEPYEVTDFYESILYQELHIVVEDGSTDEIGTLICDFYAKCCKLSEEQVLSAIRTLPKCDLSKSKSDGASEADDESSAAGAAGDVIDPSAEITEQMEKLETKEVKAKPAPDADGWTEVPTTRKKRR